VIRQSIWMESKINRTIAFRTLVGLYLICFIGSFISYRHTIVPEQARPYANLLHEMFFNPWGSISWFIFSVTNFFVMFAGAILLMFRARSGLYLFVIGSFLMRVSLFFMSNPDAYPVLQSTTSSHIYGATCTLWGAIVAIALWDRGGLFRHRDRPEADIFA
jgi:hypothetical protein